MANGKWPDPSEEKPRGHSEDRRVTVNVMACGAPPPRPYRCRAAMVLRPGAASVEPPLILLFVPSC